MPAPTGAVHSRLRRRRKSEERDNQDEDSVANLVERLRLATIRGDLVTLTNILSEGVSVDQVLKSGWNPLMFASSLGHVEVVHELLARGADANFHKEQFTSLMAACASTADNEDRLVEVAKLLLEAGAVARAQERHGLTALMLAAREGRLKLSSALINAPVPLDSQDHHGWTALHWAVNQDKSGVVELLVRSGARQDLKDRKGQTPLDLARAKRLTQVVEILEGKGSCCREEERPTLFTTDQLYHELLVELTNLANNNNGRLETEGLQKLLAKLTAKDNLDAVHDHQLSRALQPSPLLPYSPYSVRDAVGVLKKTLKQVSMLYAGVCYVRLRLQGHPLNLSLDQRATCLKALQSLTTRAHLQTDLLLRELHFLHRHTKQMDESDTIVSGDLIVEHKPTRYLAKLTTFCVIALFSIITLNKLKFISLPTSILI